MGFLDLITGTPNGYVGQNFPTGMAPATDGGEDPLAKLKELFQPHPVEMAQPAPSAPARPTAPMENASPSVDDTVINGLSGSRAPMNIAAPPPPDSGGPPADFGLLSMIAPGSDDNGSPGMRRMLASLGGGLSTVTGNTAGGAFARGMGGGLKSGTAFDRSEADLALKELRAMQAAQAAGDNARYRAARANYYDIMARTKAEAASHPASPTHRQTQWDDPRFRFDKARTAISAADKAIDNEFVNDPRARRFATPEEKKALASEIAQRKRESRQYLQKQYQVQEDGTVPAATESEPPAAKNPGEISFKGNGTQADPYQPASKADYDDIPAGAYYRHPTRGLVIKG